MKHLLACTLLLVLSLSSCSKTEDIQDVADTENFIETFKNSEKTFEKWMEDAYSFGGDFTVENGILAIKNHANQSDRTKLKTKKNSYGYGSYTWEIYTSKRDLFDQTSLGAFLYYNDEHEIDFEIGSGKETERTKLNAQEDDQLIYCVIQGNPDDSHPYLIKEEQWHTIMIKLSPASSGNYLATWFLNGNLLQKVVLEFNDEFRFHVFCSLETLNFIGDTIPNRENKGLFRRFTYTE
ncbi:MAG: hypothetical protein JKY08_06100 [Flavobacteriaceae bacterium]|nr:hypothetical protein [Flavobacteriaceae bacterium]